MAAVLLALVLAPLAALVPAAASEPTTLTTLSDGSAGASLSFETCSAVQIVYLTLPEGAHVERMNYSLTGGANQSGTVAQYFGEHGTAAANVSVDGRANVSMNGEGLNAFLAHADGVLGNVTVPLVFLGCSQHGNWSVGLGDIEVVYRLPVTVEFAVTSPHAEVTYTTDATIDVSGTVAPADCTVYVNEHAVTVDENGSFAAVVGLEIGENPLRFVACGNYGEGTVIERMVVRQNGTVDLSLEWPPAHYLTNHTTVTVSGQTEAGATVTVGGDNATVNATTGAFEHEVQLDEGENIITIVVSDGLGNETRVNITVVLDTHAPTIELDLSAEVLAAIASGIPVGWHEIGIAGTTDTYEATIAVNGHVVAHEGLSFHTGVALVDGENVIVVSVTDPAGNRAEVSITILVDLVAPSIDLDLDADIAAAIEAGTAIHNTTLKVRGTTDSEDAVIVVNEHEANMTGLNFSRTVELHDGENVIVIVAEDHAGNRREVRLTLLVDLSNPELAVTLSAEAREAIAHERPTTNASVDARVESNASTVQFYLNGQLMSEWSGSINVSITLDEGENTLLFEATEGELVSSEEFHITLDTVAPALAAELNGTTEANGTFTAHDRRLLIEGTTEAGATVHLCTAGPDANGTTWCHGVDVDDHGLFHGVVEIDAEVENTVTVIATDRAGNSNELSFTVVYERPTFGADTELTVHIGGMHEGEILAGTQIVLEVGSAAELPDGANVSWYIDGEFVGNGTRLADITLDEGNHTIEVRVEADGVVATGSRVVHVAPEAALPTPAVGGGLVGPLLALGLVVAGMAYASTDRGRYMLLGVMLGSVFTRLKKPAPLDHFVRGRLFQLVSDEPGIHYAELRRRANLSNGVVAHHLRVLEGAGILRTVQDGTRTRFFPTDKPMDPESYGLSDGDRAVLDTVTEAPGITETELSQRVGRSLSTVSRSVDRMAAMGYVTTTRQGRTVSVFPRPGNEPPVAPGTLALPSDEA